MGGGGAMGGMMIGSIFSGMKMIQGSNEVKAGEYALDMFERQDLTNTYNDIGISTYGSDLIREENARNSASMIDSARGGGTRGIMGIMGRVQANNNLANAKSVADLDGQDIKRKYSAAQDNVRIQRMQEQRDNYDLEGIGQMINNGKQKEAEGQSGLMNSMSMGGNSMGGQVQGQAQGRFNRFSENKFGGSQVGGGLNYTSQGPSMGNYNTSPNGLGHYSPPSYNLETPSF